MPSTNSVATLTLTPMTKAEAAKLLKQMLGSYPSLNLHDPESYMASIISLFCSYPLWAGERAVSKVPVQGARYPEHLQKLVGR